MSATRVAVVLGLLASAACARSGGPPSAAEENREVAIYAAVVRHMASEEGQSSGFRVIYLLDRVVENADDPDDPGAGEPFPEEDKAALSKALDGVAPVEFVPSRADVIGPAEDGGRVENQGILLTLGRIAGEEDRALVPASSYLANLAGTWQTWVVEPSDDGWRVTGTEGPVAIS
ncbi:MAG: hypothetical protein ACRDKA_00800 [Actinomycetota bacterium]